MIYPKIPLAQSLIEIFNSNGIEHIIISPGSRNAPLTLGFSNNHNFNCYSIVDERCAGFFALGMAQQLQKPVAVVCTSGSALLNYYPAIAEAFYSQIPLIVVSADRPQDKIDIGDGQTIRQENVFANHSLYNANLAEEASAENDLKIQEAVLVATSQKGPVHINIPFEEPLYETIDELTVQPILIEKSIAKKKEIDIKSLVEKWNKATKKLVLLGSNYPNAIEQQFLDRLGSDNSIVVLTEVTSNAHHQNFISNIDAIITPFEESDFLKFQPEILITIGGMIVSKRIKSFLRTYKPEQHWHIDELRAYDTFGSLTQHFEVCPNRFFADFLPQVNKIESNYLETALQIREYRAIKHKEYLSTIPFSDLIVFEFILSKLTKNLQLQISNSSAIRYAQLFSIDKSIEVYCNRGTSGIDGSTTTAIGASVVTSKPTVLITGDISFFYDSNALWNNYIPKNFKIIMINNGGGGIFRILPGHQENEVFSTYFETSHKLTAEHLSKMYGFYYIIASDLEEIEINWERFMTIEKPVLLEIVTPEKLNNGLLLEYFKKIK